jgi:hypothetical protein
VNRREHETATAAAMFRECRAELAARGGGGGIVSEAIGVAADGASAETVAWRHYPEGEVYDPATHVQYFYHRHPPANGKIGGGDVPAEGGHFHVFLRGEGIPAGISPMLFADAVVADKSRPTPQSAPLRRGRREEVCHLVAIAIGRGSEPRGLFTTNRWVTGETWYRADDMIRLIERIRFDAARPASLLDRWVEAIVCLFAPEIAKLLEERDKAILRWRWRRPRCNAFEDPGLEVASSCAIDLEARLAAIEARRMPAAGAAPIPVWHSITEPLAGDGWGR